MNDLDLIFLEMRISILEDILTKNPHFKPVYKDAYLQLKDQTDKNKPDSWEVLSSFISQQLQRLEDNE